MKQLSRKYFRTLRIVKERIYIISLTVWEFQIFRLRAPIGCNECSTVAFCGRKCRDAAVSTYHKYECKILALLIGKPCRIFFAQYVMYNGQISRRGLSPFDRSSIVPFGKNVESIPLFVGIIIIITILFARTIFRQINFFPLNKLEQSVLRRFR